MLFQGKHLQLRLVRVVQVVQVVQILPLVRLVVPPASGVWLQLLAVAVVISRLPKPLRLVLMLIPLAQKAVALWVTINTLTLKVGLAALTLLAPLVLLAQF
jgi:hypothetical protein